MNLEKIFEMQKELDRSIHKAHNVSFESTIEHKIIALIVEIGEFANEIKPFKYWKKDKTIDRDKVLEEFVDGIHFFVSIASFVKLEPHFDPLIISDDPNKQLLEIFKAVSKLSHDLKKENIQKAFRLYLGIGKICNMDFDEIFSYYVQKNKVNYERIAGNY